MVRLDTLNGADFEDFLSRVYLTMIRLGEPTREALRQEGYHDDDITRSGRILESRELIERSSADSWEVRPPEAALPRLAAEMEARARFTRANAAELGVIWRTARHRDDAAVGGLELLSSIEGIVAAADSIESLATLDLRTFCDASPASLRRLAAEPAVHSSEASRRTVLDIAVLEVPEVMERVHARILGGEQVRVAEGVPFSGVVADDRAVVVDLSRHDESGDGSYVGRRPAAVQAMTALFEIAFEMSTPLTPTLAARAEGGTGGAPLDERDARVLGLLAIGASDQMIARQVGSSTRTVERRVRYLMEHLGAATRFQAGVQAARRGWI